MGTVLCNNTYCENNEGGGRYGKCKLLQTTDNTEVRLTWGYEGDNGDKSECSAHKYRKT